MELDSQVVEIIGRHWLIGELLRAGLEVALPVRDRGVDLLVCTGENLDPIRFQMKAATKERFGVDLKYEKLPGLLSRLSVARPGFQEYQGYREGDGLDRNRFLEDGWQEQGPGLQHERAE